MQSFYTPSTTTHISSHGPAAVDELINKYSSTMATTSPSPGIHTFDRAQRNILQRIADRIRLGYYRYEVTYGLYVMTPGEKIVANTFVVVFLGLLIWAMFFYFPGLLFQKFSRLVWLLTGQSGEEMGAALGILDTQPSISQFASQKAALS
ncbi:predicted protein [Aspergillus nidulans FGSC A4]|uniref:Uncharacterized protein n=1 Tax=Emericella nidulans (strain FGSC A4 / ATCC 38163 / CBS 112.46 / NRRL 194 / M139) TaxID=227321 RepID=Q5AWJ4_EMENI|nr:hypothetical protein [Aspergillus nidulans FGSC A4]EAA61707.1 predicted protein [Aspergillus nidulans FGSC A4]CBF78593.1 TPA: conserved hypothetical protein [Aspergillus nidulans FGSC A4]|eukprot:XP_680605.1 predicted protein [Aspergillus nidulans FGSC A4]